MQDERIKILQIVGNARLGGVSSCILNYYRHTDLKKFSFDFVTYAPSVFDDRVKEIDPDARVYYISPFQKNFLKALFDLEKVCGANDYDAVHSHLTTLSAFALTSAAHAGVPVRICHVHSAFNKKSEHYLAKSFLRPFAAEHATHLMACSRHAAENIFGKRAKEAIILPDAIEAEKFYSSAEEYSAARKKLGLDGKVILFVGRFVYQKNLPFLVRAFAAAAENENMTLVLLGDGEERHEIHKISSELDVADKVKIIPPCNPADWYKAADLFCLPSRYEGLGMAAIEAQAAGLKCLLSESVPKEADVTGKCVYLPDDLNAWTKELKKPAPHFYDCKEAIAASHYDIALEAHRLEDFYVKAVTEARRR